MKKDRVRMTITVPAATHAVFQQMADVSGLSLGRVMGDWLADTADGAVLITQKLVEAKQAPKRVMREMQVMSRQLVREVDELTDELRSSGWKSGADVRAAQAAPGSVAPSSNTGLKSPPSKAKKGKTNV